MIRRIFGACWSLWPAAVPKVVRLKDKVEPIFRVSDRDEHRDFEVYDYKGKVKCVRKGADSRGNDQTG